MGGAGRPLASVATALLLVSGVVLQTAIGSIRSAAHVVERPNRVFVMTLSKLLS
jgi:hypothetical protein